MKITKKWTTIAIVGFAGSVSRHENRAAHGAVCLLQARQGTRGVLGRRINSNGRHCEISDSFHLDDVTLAQWSKIGDSQ